MVKKNKEKEIVRNHWNKKRKRRSSKEDQRLFQRGSWIFLRGFDLFCEHVDFFFTQFPCWGDNQAVCAHWWRCIMVVKETGSPMQVVVVGWTSLMTAKKWREYTWNAMGIHRLLSFLRKFKSVDGPARLLSFHRDEFVPRKELTRFIKNWNCRNGNSYTLSR